MRINDNQLPGIASSPPGASQNVRSTTQPGVSPTKPGEAADGKDAVHLSSVADQVGNLTTPERAAKIAELAKLVESGRYNPDPEKVADSIINDMLTGPGSS